MSGSEAHNAQKIRVWDRECRAAPLDTVVRKAFRVVPGSPEPASVDVHKPPMELQCPRTSIRGRVKRHCCDAYPLESSGVGAASKMSIPGPTAQRF